MKRDLLDTIERYYDAVPRTAARAEEMDPFVLFVQPGQGWQYYARPVLGASTFEPEEVSRVRSRQRELGVPEAFEWVAETTPALHAAAESAGLAVAEHPLMVLNDVARERPGLPQGISVRLVTPDDDLSRLSAVAHIGFRVGGTARSDVGHEAVDREVLDRTPDDIAFRQERLRAGLTIMAAAYREDVPVAVGSHQPIGDVTEIVGVATLPAFRRQGIGAALTDVLVRDARSRGARIVFLSAGNDDVARMYEHVGFRRVGTACIAEPGAE